MKYFCLAFVLFTLNACSVITSPASWNAKPAVIDEDQAIFTALSDATDTNTLIQQGNAIRKKVQLLIATTRKNLDRTSAGNYGAGLIAAGIGLSSLHSDALLGASYLAGTHVALSTRLSPEGYMQQLRKTSSTFSCLNQANLSYFNAVNKAVNVANLMDFAVSTEFSAMGYVADVYSFLENDFEKIKQAYLRALELTQDKLDTQISLSSPTDIKSQLIEASKQAAKGEQQIETLTDEPPPLKEFLKEHEKLDAELILCIALI